ncbi:hypothetical protein L6452_01769 [Arctium lappa]|uniref:Uncharacterized protein n=1 Tax=Arctium lappa TaxID=4217 RepID=A0ACB9FHN6_ARCLA|nr:hypothetical protein L6452_01769 [Arctium lappa]
MGLLGEKDQLSHSINTNSTTKRVKLPKKFLIIVVPLIMLLRQGSYGQKRDTKKHKAVAVSNRSEAQKPMLGFEEEFKDSKVSSVMCTEEWL